MSTSLVSLLVQGVGGLFLGLVCGTLYVSQRRTFFRSWSLSWLCFSLGLLLGGLGPEGAAGLPVSRWWARDFAAVCGGWQAALWASGMVACWRGYRIRETILLPGVAVVTVLAVRVLSWPAWSGVLAGWLALTYGISAVLFFRLRGRLGHGAVLLFVLFLARAATEGFFPTARSVEGEATGPLPAYLDYLSFADFFLQTLTGCALLTTFLSQEPSVLRDALERLAESEDRFRVFFEHSGVGMALFTPKGHFLQINPALVRFLGYRSEELRGKYLADLAPKEAPRSGPGSSVKALEEPPELYEREKRYLRKDGGEVWARVLRVPVRDPAGRVRYFVGVLVDVTSRRRAEEALAASEERYRLRFQDAFDGIHIWAETGEFLDANPAFCRMLGYTRDELLVRTVADVAGDLALTRRHFIAVLAWGGDRFETRLRRKEGTWVDVEVSSSAIELRGRKLVHSITRDVSERKRAEEALRENAQHMKMAAVAGRLGIWYRDLLTNAVTTLQDGGPVSGTHPSSYKAFLGVVHPDDRPLVVESMAAAAERGEDYQAEFRVIRTGGDLRWAYALGRVVRDPTGKPVAMTGLDIDITERKQAEEERRRLETQVQHAQKMESLGVLAGGIAHDFNNLLTAILGNIAYCLANIPAGDPSHEVLATAEQAGWRAAELVRQLLGFSRRSVLRPEATDLNSSLDEVVGILRRTLDPRVVVEVRPAPDLWAVEVDPGQISQVLMNLCLNARDAMPEGGRLVLETANVVIDEEYTQKHLDARPGKFVRVRVSDTGPGIPPEIRPRIFEPFFTTKEPGKGTGLGLAMVFSIAQQHQGWVECASDVSRGTRFDIYLPPLFPRARGAGTPVVPRDLPSGQETILLGDQEPMAPDRGQSVLRRPD